MRFVQRILSWIQMLLPASERVGFPLSIRILDFNLPTNQETCSANDSSFPDSSSCSEISFFLLGLKNDQTHSPEGKPGKTRQ